MSFHWPLNNFFLHLSRYLASEGNQAAPSLFWRPYQIWVKKANVSKLPLLSNKTTIPLQWQIVAKENSAVHGFLAALLYLLEEPLPLGNLLSSLMGFVIIQHQILLLQLCVHFFTFPISLFLVLKSKILLGHLGGSLS